MAGGAAQAASHSALVQRPARSRDSGKRFRFTPGTREHARNSQGGRQERERPQRPEAKGGAQADVHAAPPHARPRSPSSAHPRGPALRPLASVHHRPSAQPRPTPALFRPAPPIRAAPPHAGSLPLHLSDGSRPLAAAPPLPSALEAEFRRRKMSTGGHRRDSSAAFRSSPSKSSRQEVVSGARATRGRPPHGDLAQPLV